MRRPPTELPRWAGPDGDNGEFDTPIDPRFPTYLATNLSEALPGPFSPSSASVTVRGLRAGGVVIAERLRPGGIDPARNRDANRRGVRAPAVWGHHVAHFMAETVPFVKPATVIVRNSGFFGPSMASLPILRRATSTARIQPRHEADCAPFATSAVFAVNLVGLTTGAARDTRDFIDDVDRLEELAAGDLSRLADERLLSLIMLARDHVVHGWVLASASFMLCAAFNVVLRGLCGRDTVLPVGPELVSAQPLERGVPTGGRRATRPERDPDSGPPR